MLQTGSADQRRAFLIEFADKYLFPYKIRSKQRDNTEEIIPQYCPFCHGGDSKDEDTFALSVDKGVYVCKRGSCGQRGQFDQLLNLFHEEADVSKLGFSKHREKKQAVLPDTVLRPPTQQIYDYFALRKISRETVDAFHVASDDHGMIVFPFYMDGVNVYEKFRRPWKPRPTEKGKEWAFPGAKPVLFGMDLCSFSQPLVITEGMIDAMSLYEAGVHNVTSVPSGCECLDWIENCYDWLEHFHTIILFGDNDEPGRKMVQKVVQRLDESRCMIVEDYPDRPEGGQCKDANEILYRYGWSELVDMVDKAKAVPIKGIIDLSTVVPYDPTGVTRIRTMIPKLDEVIGGLVEGGITVFTGRSGQGKSTLTGLLLLNAIEQGYSVCAYSGELRKEKFQEWINFQLAGSDYITLKHDPIRGKDIPFIPYPIQERLADYYKGKFFLFDNNEIFEHDQAHSILDVFTVGVRRYGCKLFLVDNMMTSLSDSEEETKAQGRFVNALKKFATRYSVHVLIVAHPRKTKVGETLRKDDVGGNSAIVNLADSAIVVERPNIRIIKNREEGIETMIECVYCPDSRRIYQNGKGDLNCFTWNHEDILPFTGSSRADSMAEYKPRLAETDPF